MPEQPPSQQSAQFRDEVTPPGGTSAPNSPYELVDLIRGLRAELVFHRQALAAAVTPAPRAKAGALALTGNVAKWGAVAVGVLGVASQIAAMFRPDLVGPIQTVIQLIGGAP